MFYAYVVNGPGCLLCLAVVGVLFLLHWLKAGDAVTLLTIGGVLLIDLIGRAVANFRRHPATRERRWFYLPSTGAHFNYVPVWMLGVLVLLALPVEKLVKVYIAGEYPFGERQPVVQTPQGSPPDQKPVVQPPPVSRKPVTTGAKFEYEVKKSQRPGEAPAYEIFVTSRHDKPLTVLAITYKLIGDRPGTDAEHLATERNVMPGQRLSALLNSAADAGTILINGSGREADGTKVSFSCRWPL